MSKKNSNFTFGSDPEFMITQNGKCYSAIEIIKHGKEDKLKVGDNYFYYDNVMVEAAIQPSSSKEEAIANFRNMLVGLASVVRPKKIECRASADFDKGQLVHPKAIEVGCTAEYCAYELMTIIPPVEQFATGTLRTSGGHVHIGANIAKDEYGRLHIIRLLDLFLGIPAIFIDKDPTSPRRKELYGSAGRFREPPHGCEYRSIGNFWISSPKLVGLVYDIAEFTTQFVAEGRCDKLWFIDKKKIQDDKSYEDVDFTVASCHRCIGYDVELLRKTINKMDVKNAKTFMPLLAEHMPANLFADINKAIENAQQFDLYKEWGIK